MKMKKRIKQGVAALALMLAVPAMTYQSIQAATGIETDKSCSVEIQVDGDFAELKTLDIAVNFYKVADVEETGAYTALDGFQDLGLDKVNSETTAQKWEEIAGQAADLIRVQNANPTETAVIEEGTGMVRDLDTGMYLVEAQQVQSSEYTYSFTPYLVSLPNNYYSSSGDDTWVYDVTAGLKPEQELRYGSIQINKTLDVYNATLGGASFIFSVEAVKDGETVYSDVVSLVFDGPGTKSVEVGNIPAGAQVTVTEVYSGSSYQIVGDNVEIAAITADTAAQVSFANTYDGQNNGGSSVLNHFTYTTESQSEDGSGQSSGTWSWSQHTDSTDMQK